MNVQAHPSPDAGVRPRRFTTDDIFKMIDAGVLDPDEKIELIEGEIVVLPSKQNAHEIAKSALIRFLARRAPDDVTLAVESTLYLRPDLFVEPDLLLYPAGLKPQEVRGPDVLLAVEVADSSLQRDLGLKAWLYARDGVRDYWVVDAENRRVVMHRDPAGESYRSVETFEADVALAPLFAPELRVRLADLL